MSVTMVGLLRRMLRAEGTYGRVLGCQGTESGGCYLCDPPSLYSLAISGRAWGSGTAGHVVCNGLGGGAGVVVKIERHLGKGYSTPQSVGVDDSREAHS